MRSQSYRSAGLPETVRSAVPLPLTTLTRALPVVASVPASTCRRNWCVRSAWVLSILNADPPLAVGMNSAETLPALAGSALAKELMCANGARWKVRARVAQALLSVARTPPTSRIVKRSAASRSVVRTRPPALIQASIASALPLTWSTAVSSPWGVTVTPAAGLAVSTPASARTVSSSG